MPVDRSGEAVGATQGVQGDSACGGVARSPKVSSSAPPSNMPVSAALSLKISESAPLLPIRLFVCDRSQRKGVIITTADQFSKAEKFSVDHVLA